MLSLHLQGFHFLKPCRCKNRGLSNLWSNPQRLHPGGLLSHRKAAQDLLATLNVCRSLLTGLFCFHKNLCGSSHCRFKFEDKDSPLKCKDLRQLMSHTVTSSSHNINEGLVDPTDTTAAQDDGKLYCIWLGQPGWQYCQPQTAHSFRTKPEVLSARNSGLSVASERPANGAFHNTQDARATPR